MSNVSVVQGDGQHDRRPAGVRAELPGHPDLRLDARHRHDAEAVRRTDVRRVLTLAVLLAVATAAGAATLYLSKVVSADPVGLVLGDLVQVAGELPSRGAGAARPVGGRARRTDCCSCPPRFSGTCSGERSGTVRRSWGAAPWWCREPWPSARQPRARPARRTGWTRRADSAGEPWSCEVLKAPDPAALPAATSGFTLVRAERSSGLFDGVVEVSFAGAREPHPPACRFSCARLFPRRPTG